MAQIVPIVNVLDETTKTHHVWLSRSLSRRNPTGRSVGEVLADADSQSLVKIFLDESSKSLFRKASELKGNKFLANIVQLGYVAVDVSPLMNHDKTERVIVGFGINWTEAESKALGLVDQNPSGPRVQSQA